MQNHIYNTAKEAVHPHGLETPPMVCIAFTLNLCANSFTCYHTTKLQTSMLKKSSSGPIGYPLLSVCRSL